MATTSRMFSILRRSYCGAAAVSSIGRRTFVSTSSVFPPRDYFCNTHSSSDAIHRGVSSIPVAVLSLFNHHVVPDVLIQCHSREEEEEAKQSQHSLVVIKSYLRERVETYMKVLGGMSQSFNDIKNLTLLLPAKSWKIEIPYTDISLAYRRDEETDVSLASPFEECSKGQPLRGFKDDEKFWYVASRQGQRPRELCPIDSTTFETLKVQHANINQEDIETDHEDQMKLQQADDIPCEVVDTVSHDSNAMKTVGDTADDEEDDGKEETSRDAANDIIFKPAKRVREVRSIDSDAMETNDGANDDDGGIWSQCLPYNPSMHWHTSRSRVPREKRVSERMHMRPERMHMREKQRADKKYLVDAPCK